ncbi:MAG: biopolymer transporter ExbD [Phycisphaerae bacterium]|nr:biopolymer transporter ExbD [Phycisphaerae bacterium]
MNSVNADRPREYPRGMGRHVLEALRRRRTPGTGIRMTPMIDVVFLLLTFFILTIRFRVPEEFLPITLPSALQARRIGIVEPLEINIAAHPNGCMVAFGPGGRAGELLIGTDTIDADLTALTTRFVEVLQTQQRNVGDPIEVICSDAVSWDHLVKIYNILYAMGINDITFGMTH